MSYLIITILIVVACLGLIVYVVYQRISFNQALEQRKIEQANVKQELYYYHEKLCTELQNQYDDCLRTSEYKKTNSPIITTSEKISLFIEKLDPKYEAIQIFDIWKNDTNLCCITNINGLWAITKETKDKSWYRYSREQISEAFNNPSCRVNAFSIPIANIEYFLLEGQKYATTDVVGGGGTVGGSSLKGAIGGGIIAGNAGAVIGSRKETTIDPVRSYTEIHDERTTCIKYKDKEGSLKEIVSGFNAEIFFNILKELIPEKEYSYIMAHKQVQTNVHTNNVEDRIAKANDLLEKQLITQEEYEKMRKDILASI